MFETVLTYDPLVWFGPELISQDLKVDNSFKVDKFCIQLGNMHLRSLVRIFPSVEQNAQRVPGPFFRRSMLQ